MIALQGVRAKALPKGTQNGAIYMHLSLELGAGCHAIVGATPAEARLLLDLAAGHVRARRGSVRALDGAPGEPSVAARTAFVPLDVVLPDSLTVLEIAALEAALRGRTAAATPQRLALLDAEWLGPRRAHTLSSEEQRAVALALALTSGASLLLLEEPLAQVEGRAAPLVAPALRALVAKGDVCVVLTTASRRDAELLGASSWALRDERLIPLPGLALGSATLEIVVDDPMRLAAALAATVPRAALTLHADRQSVVVETTDLDATAATVARIALAESLAIVAMFRRGDDTTHTLAEAAQRLPSLMPPAPLAPDSAEPPAEPGPPAAPAAPAPAESAP